MMGEGIMFEVGIEVEAPKLLDPPNESNQLAKEWKKRIQDARQHWEKFHKRVKHNRKIVSGYDWEGDAESENFYVPRANLILSTITSLLSTLYAKNPEISVTPVHTNDELKLYCKTLETVTGNYLDHAFLKERMKATVRAAMTVSFGAIKVMYQREYGKDPVIMQKIEDAQDNLKRAKYLAATLNDAIAIREQEAISEELEHTLRALNERVEVLKEEGLVIDRVLTENLLVDPACEEFADYPQADWIAQIVPMKKSDAEAEYGYKLDNATRYGDNKKKVERASVFRGKGDSKDNDALICIIEIWDKKSQNVYTMAEGCDFWLREPYSPPRVGKRWYPFFLLPYTQVDGKFIAPSVVDLTEKLQAEHNEARDKFNAHRDLVRPGYIAAGDVNEKTIRRYADSLLGEITLIDVEGQPVNQVIVPKQHPPFDITAYDTSASRQDWEMVTGLQDANRGNVSEAKTATEARIMQQGLSSRVAEFRDKIEDMLTEVASYAAQILALELTADKVEKIMGPHKMVPEVLPNGMPAINPLTGQAMMKQEPAYFWPELSRQETYDMVSVTIRAGTTGEPDKLESQERISQLAPAVQPLITQIMQLQLQGIDASALIALLREIITRYDDRIDADVLIPKLKPAMQQQMQQPMQTQAI